MFVSSRSWKEKNKRKGEKMKKELRRNEEKDRVAKPYLGDTFVNIGGFGADVATEFTEVGLFGHFFIRFLARPTERVDKNNKISREKD
jgi:hypothetical protein